jgi:hypothetical protein
MPLSSRRRDCPWPGPVPYKEEDEPRFFGRGEETDQLMSSITHRLSILTALSGVGKSSLLQAALVPALRNGRERRSELGPVLVLRNWGLLGSGSPERMFILAIWREIKRLLERVQAEPESQLKRDVTALDKIPVPPELDEARLPIDILLDYVTDLCHAVGGLVLIVDQAEELLGSGLGPPNRALEERVLHMIGELVGRDGPPHLKVMLSLREEYQARLKPLDGAVAGLEKRTFRLDPMAQATTRQVILDSAQVAGHASLEEKELDSILSWLGETREARISDSSPVDLLRLQALLVYIFEWIAENTAAAGERAVVIDAAALERFRQAHPGDNLGQYCLEYYLESILTDSDGGSGNDSATGEMIRRTVARMAPWLSSPGGFKRHLEESELVGNAVREDLEGLGVNAKSDDLRLAVNQLRAGTLQAMDFEPGPELELKTRLSGPAIARDWGITEAALLVLRCGLQAIEALERGEVLKVGQWGGMRACELVHDGFGPALIGWAEKQRGTLRDTLSSVVSRRGETFRWHEIGTAGEDLVIADICWLGCNISRTTIKRTVFRRCILSGTIFTDCQIEECRFEDCDLNGCVFRGGAWSNATWQRCEGASTLFAGLEWSDVDFESSVLTGATMIGLDLAGKVRFEDCRLTFAQILEIGRRAGGRLELSESDVRHSLFHDKDASWVDWRIAANGWREGLVGDVPGAEDVPVRMKEG